MVKHKYCRGFYTILSITLLTIVASVAAGMLSQLKSAEQTTSSTGYSDKALYIAEAGLQFGIKAVQNRQQAQSTKQNFAGGNFVVTISNLVVNNVTQSNDFLIRSVGSYQSANRTLELTIRFNLVDYLMVGDRKQFAKYNAPNWIVQGPFSSLPDKKMYAVSCHSEANCWAVGEHSSGPLMVKYDGTNWIRHTTGISSLPDKKLYGIDCPSATTCWAVGEDDGGYLILKWDGVSWTRASFSGQDSSKKLFGISCSSSTNCWAVGEKSAIVRYDGIIWTEYSVNSYSSKNLLSIHCLSNTRCYAVGEAQAGEMFLIWNGSSWSRLSPSSGVADVNFNDIHCVNENQCWIAADADAKRLHYLRWNGSYLVSHTSSDSYNRAMLAMSCGTDGECWMAGEDYNGYALILHYTNGTWNILKPSSGWPTKTVYGLSDLPKTEVIIGKWSEIIN